MAARAALEQVWSDYRSDPAFDALRSWKDLELGPLNFVPGEGSVCPFVTFIGEAPGAEEDRIRRPFVGQSGQLVRSLIEEELDLVPEVDCWITNVVKYRPAGNATPTLRDQTNSWPYLRRELECLSPRAKVVVPLGATAWSVFPHSAGQSISAWQGKMMMGKSGWLIVPMFHPAYIGRNSAARLPSYRRSFAVIREAMEAPE